MISNQLTLKQVSDRDALITSALRPDGAPFSIADEYPTILNPDFTEHSYCVLKKQRVIAHANLWPRIMTTADEQISLHVGLIGNVATDHRHRGKGLMKQLMVHLVDEAKDQKLDALILWSDLLQFYQKLGFESFGRESRYHLSAKKIAEKPFKSRQFFPIRADDLRPSELRTLLSLRPKCDMTIKREQFDFKELLSIPATRLYVCYQDSKLSGYGIFGRGCDMVGVVHEWGVSDPKTLESMPYDICNDLGLSKLIFLSPSNLCEKFNDVLLNYATKVESCDMALVMPLSQRFADHGRKSTAFIWGLDSI